MTGHQQLIAMRRAGVVPAAVFFTDGLDRTAADWHLHPNNADGRLYASVQIDAPDIPEALDLRYVVGLTVHLAGCRNEARTRRMFAALAQAKPKKLASVIGDEVLFHG